MLVFPRLFFITLASAVAIPATAQTYVPPDVSSAASDEIVVYVPYGDLDLHRDVDQLVLKSRVKEANHKACVDIYSSWYGSAGMLCEHIAWEIAKPHIDRAIADAGLIRIGYNANLAIKLGQ